MFVNAAPLFGIIKSYRICHIAGRPGGHKTSFAYAMSEPFLKEGYRLVTNNRSIWVDEMDRIELNSEGMMKTVVIVDEGGRYFKSSAQMEAVLSFPAKMDLIILIPSFWPPTRSAQIITVQPLFSLKSAGLPVIFYSWHVHMGEMRDHGNFIWVNPQEIYGIYSRRDPGASAEKIIDWLIKRTKDYVRFEGRGGSDESVSGPESYGVPTVVQATSAEIIADAALTFADSIESQISSVSGRGGKRRRRF